MDTATHQLPLWNRLKIDLAEVHIRTDRGEVVVVDRIHHQLLAVFKGIEVVEDKALRSRDLQRFALSAAGNQPKLPFLARL